jgi:hypothetical protein
VNSLFRCTAFPLWLLTPYSQLNLDKCCRWPGHPRFSAVKSFTTALHAFPDPTTPWYRHDFLHLLGADSREREIIPLLLRRMTWRGKSPLPRSERSSRSGRRMNVGGEEPSFPDLRPPFRSEHRCRGRVGIPLRSQNRVADGKKEKGN